MSEMAYIVPCMCKNLCKLFTCKEMIGFIRHDEFLFCEFHFLLCFWVIVNITEFEWQKTLEHVNVCRFPRCHRTLL